MPAEEDSAESSESSGGALGGLARRSRREQMSIAEFEDAGDRPIVLWVYTNSIERRYNRAREASNTFFEEVLNTPVATAELAGCLCLKIEGVDLDRDLCREYNIRRNSYPQLLIYDHEGDHLYRLGRCTAENVAQAIQQAKERVERMIERDQR